MYCMVVQQSNINTHRNPVNIAHHVLAAVVYMPHILRARIIHKRARERQKRMRSRPFSCKRRNASRRDAYLKFVRAEMRKRHTLLAWGAKYHDRSSMHTQYLKIQHTTFANITCEKLVLLPSSSERQTETACAHCVHCALCTVHGGRREFKLDERNVEEKRKMQKWEWIIFKPLIPFDVSAVCYM